MDAENIYNDINSLYILWVERERFSDIDSVEAAMEMNRYELSEAQ